MLIVKVIEYLSPAMNVIQHSLSRQSCSSSLHPLDVRRRSYMVCQIESSNYIQYRLMNSIMQVKRTGICGGLIGDLILTTSWHFSRDQLYAVLDHEWNAVSRTGCFYVSAAMALATMGTNLSANSVNISSQRLCSTYCLNILRFRFLLEQIWLA